jgi:poly(3-hydroxyoctanoate) depolymerase
VTTGGGRLLTFARVDGDLLRVSVRGEGRPLLLIMGLGGNIEMWRPMEDALVERGIQTIAYDASGTGESPPRVVPRRMAGLARQAAHLLDALAIPSADVLGVSVGLVGVPGNPVALGLLATPLRYYSPAFFRRTAHLMYGPLDADGDNDLLQAQANARRARPPSVWGYASQLAATAGWTSLPWLHRIRKPVLVLSGDSDPIVPPLNARILAARLPDAELEIVPGAGHLLLMQRAAPLAAHIAAFLSAGV